MENLKTKLHYYRFDISQLDQKKEYLKLKNLLESKGYKLFDSIGPDDYEWYKKIIFLLNNETIELETNYIFNNQWNTTPILNISEHGIRVMDWAEAIYPNRKIKEGYYLEMTSEMTNIRKVMTRCHYCGKMQYRKEGVEKCEHCEKEGYLIKLDSPKSFDFI